MGRAEGVLFSLVASFCASMGLVLQKHSHNMKEWDNSSCQWRWWIGLVFVCVGGLFDSMALLNAPLIDIAPLTSVTVLLNALLSNFFLGEYVGPIEICATIVIFLGATTTCIFGASDMGTHDLWQYRVPHHMRHVHGPVVFTQELEPRGPAETGSVAIRDYISNDWWHPGGTAQVHC